MSAWKYYPKVVHWHFTEAEPFQNMSKVLTLSRKKKALALMQANRLSEAKSLYADICRSDARDAEAWFMLGAVNGQLGLFDETIACCHRVLAIQPRHADAHYNLAQALLHQRRPEEAMVSYREVLRLDPNYMGAYINLGTLLQGKRQLDEAVGCFQEALRRQPQNADAHYNLGNALRAQGKYTAAVESYRAALRIQPRNSGIRYNLANTLNDQGLHDAALASYRETLRWQSDYVDAHNNLLFALNYSAVHKPEEVFTEHQRWAERHGAAFSAPHYANIPDPERRLRVGYLSPDFRQHSVASFIEPLLAAHDPAAVETVCYADLRQSDAVTARIQGLAARWRPITNLSHEQVTELVRADGIDILVDLAGHTGDNRLLVFARKPAPVQATYLGYPNTTGLPAVGYRLTDAWADPPGQTEHLYTETLIRLPHGFLCYQPPADAPSVAPLPAGTAGHVTFGSFNALTKMNGDVLATWAGILRAVPGSRLILKNMVLRDPATCERYREFFAKEEISFDRVELIGWVSSPAEHMALYHRLDLALDTFPYNGTTTTCEALWMGVPVITLAGRVHAGRVGVSLLSQVGLTEFIATDPDDYAARAVRWANDLEGLAHLRAGLRERMAASPLCDGASFARDVEQAYREMWRKWCAQSRTY